MTIDKLNAQDGAGASVKRRPSVAERCDARGGFRVVCKDKHGRIKWAEEFPNVVTTVGKNEVLDEALAGSGYTAAWYMGLIDDTGYTTGPVAGDTMASHGGWAENQNYDETNRVTTAWSSAASGSKSLSAALDFSMNTNSDAVKGVFLCDNSTKGGTTGVLLSAGLFTGGDKSVDSGDTLSCSYSLAL
jgi:hypothetical protein